MRISADADQEPSKMVKSCSSVDHGVTHEKTPVIGEVENCVHVENEGLIIRVEFLLDRNERLALGLDPPFEGGLEFVKVECRPCPLAPASNNRVFHD